MNKLNISAVLFDLGSTLIDYEPIPWEELTVECTASTHDFLTKLRHSIPDKATFHTLFDSAKQPFRNRASADWIEWTVPQAAESFLTSLGIRLEVHEHDQFFDAYYEPIACKLTVYDDTLAVLEKIASRFGKAGLISNTIFPERVHRGELDRFGIAPYLKFAIFSSTFQVRKPHPDIFTEGAKLAGIDPSKCVYVGDRYLEDITGPAKIGMSAILKQVKNRDYPDPFPAELRSIVSLSDLSRHIDI
jgi:HAD superfamily hydrolase (TIGR01549 family)